MSTVASTVPSSGGTTIVRRTRRNAELLMLLFAAVLGLGGWLLTGLNTTGRVPTEWPWVVGIWVGMALVCHVAVRWRAPYADPLLVPMVVLLNGLGLAMIHRIDLIADPDAHRATQQFMWTALGILTFLLVVFVLRDVRKLDRFPYLIFLAGIVLLLLPMVPGLGRSVLGARIWIRVGPFSFQPSELAKVLLATAFAAYLVERREVLALTGYRLGPLQLPRLRDLMPIALMWAMSMMVLVVQNDLGTALLFFGLFVVMLYVSTERVGWVVVGTLLFAAGGLLANAFVPHVRVRMDAWLHPFAHRDASYQIIQSQYGYAWGGLTGRGWGLGRPGLTPLSWSDFIAAAIGEELGLVGLMAVIAVYGIIITRALRTSLVARQPFSKLLACGLGFVFALQVFAIIGGVTRLLPLTGLTTPFMSQGGSSIICNWAIIGLLVLISHEARRPAVTPADRAAATDAEDDPGDEPTRAIPMVGG